jgi:excinuclease UvrABC nuclease subunit
MKIIRKMFPYRDTCELNSPKMCFNAQIKLCPGVCIGQISEEDYAKNVTEHPKAFSKVKKTEIKDIS